MKALRDLCGGSPTNTTKLASIQNILGREIERYGEAVCAMLQEGAENDVISLYGCFAARKMLEAGCVAILSRLDPPRVLILREFQLRGKYALNERHPAAIDWASDIVSEKRAAWGESLPPDKFVRSLLGGHLAEAAWIPAIESMVKLPSQQVPLGDSEWINSIIEQYESRKAGAAEVAAPKKDNGQEDAKNPVEVELGILSAFRTTARHSFSILSKGVHLEFVVEQEARFDIPTVLESMKQATKVLTQIAFVSNLIETAFTALDPVNALELVCEIERRIER